LPQQLDDPLTREPCFGRVFVAACERVCYVYFTCAGLLITLSGKSRRFLDRFLFLCWQTTEIWVTTGRSQKIKSGLSLNLSIGMFIHSIIPDISIVPLQVHYYSEATFPLSCAHVRAHTSCKTSAHKKTWSAHKRSFQKPLCTYFIHVIPNTVKSW